MMNRSFSRTCAFFAFIGLVSLAAEAKAVVLAEDNASDAAYAFDAAGSWAGIDSSAGGGAPGPFGTDNGGTGFGTWEFGGFHLPADSPYGDIAHFIDGVDFAASPFNDLGSPAFALTNTNTLGFNVSTSANRPFSSAMAMGDVFTMDFDTPAIYDSGGLAGSFPFAIIVFDGATGADTFSLRAGSSFNFGEFDWTFEDANGTDQPIGASPIAPTATSDGSALRFEMTGATTGEVTFDVGGADEAVFNVDFIDGAPTAVNIIIFDNRSGDGFDADFDGDDDEDGADFLTWQRGFKSFGGFGTKADGNANSNPGDFGFNEIDGEDLNIWEQGFGNTSVFNPTGEREFFFNNLMITDSAGSPSSAAGVPEPSSVGLVIAGLAGLLFRRCR